MVPGAIIPMLKLMHSGSYLALEAQALQQLLKPNKYQAVLGGFGSELIKHLAVPRGFKVPLNHIPLAFCVGLRLRASTLNVCGVGWAGVEGWLISEILHSGYQHLICSIWLSEGKQNENLENDAKEDVGQEWD